VHDPEYDGCHDKRIAKAGARGSELPTQLDPVPIEPTARNEGYTIGASDRGLSENACEDLKQADVYLSVYTLQETIGLTFPTTPPTACTAKISKASS